MSNLSSHSSKFLVQWSYLFTVSMPRWLPQILSHNMKLNPAKCKEMFINFLPNSNSSLNHIVIGNNVIEQVENYKILEVIINHELKWNNRVDFIFKKASKKLYSLRILCRAGVTQDNILKGFSKYSKTCIRICCPCMSLFWTIYPI